jgi:hypothetical protein
LGTLTDQHVGTLTDQLVGHGCGALGLDSCHPLHSPEDEAIVTGSQNSSICPVVCGTGSGMASLAQAGTTTSVQNNELQQFAQQYTVF